MSISAVFASVVLMMFFFITTTSGQTNKKSSGENKPIPEDVMKIVKKSCTACHSESTGSYMALSKINFTKWNGLTPEKQASDAKKMCKMVEKGKMPPKRYKKKNPETVPTSDDVNTICKWSESLQTAKK